MSLFESSITGNILNDGSTTEISGITAGQLATVLTAYTPLTDTATNRDCRLANAGRQPASGPRPRALRLGRRLGRRGRAHCRQHQQRYGTEHKPHHRLGGESKPIRSGCPAAGGGRQVHSCKRGHQAPGLQQHSGHELGHSKRQQRNPGQRGVKLRPSNGHRPAGFGSRRQAVGARRGSEDCHGAFGPAQHHRPDGGGQPEDHPCRRRSKGDHGPAHVCDTSRVGRGPGLARRQARRGRGFHSGLAGGGLPDGGAGGQCHRRGIAALHRHRGDQLPAGSAGRQAGLCRSLRGRLCSGSGDERRRHGAPALRPANGAGRR